MKSQNPLSTTESKSSELTPQPLPDIKAESPQEEGPNFSERGKSSTIPDHNHPTLFSWTEDWPLANFLHGKGHHLIKFIRRASPSGQMRFFFKFELGAEVEKIIALWESPEGYRDVKDYNQGQVHIRNRIIEYRALENGRSKR